MGRKPAATRSEPPTSETVVPTPTAPASPVAAKRDETVSGSEIVRLLARSKSAATAAPKPSPPEAELVLARSILEAHGYDVVTADGMAQGLATARQGKLDLILSDVCMAQGSGYEFIRAVKDDPGLRETHRKAPAKHY